MKVNKTLLISFFTLFVLAFSVSAWHCTDTDATTPKPVHNLYGTWGDNGLLNGTTLGWTADGNAPAGCSGTQGNYVCNDHCSGNTLVEYYCGDRPADSVAYQDCHKESYQDCVNTTKTVCTVYTGTGKNKKCATWANETTTKCTTKYHDVCTTKYKTTTYAGETVIFSKNYEDSTQCIPQTPEFGVMAGGVALIGALGIFLYKRK